MSDFYEIADNGLVRGYFTLAQFNSGVSVAQRDLIAVELDVKDNSYFLLDYKSKEEEKEWLDISMIDAQGKSYIVGLYKDTKASSSSTSHVPSGLFVAERYTDQKGIRGIKYVEMDLKSMADHLPKNSSEELEKGKLRFEINTIERFENDFIVFYSEVRSCPGQESLVPTRCKRLMYACARLTLQGDIVWNKPIYEKAKDAAERRVNFRLSLDENKLFITYHGSHAAKSELRDHLNLVFIDLGTGQMKVNEAPVVQVGMPPIEGKAILEDTASYNNERIYVYKELNQEVPSIILSVLRPVD